MEANMRASSESIAQLAAAMAKAQSELVNPIKSLTAVLERGRTGLGPISYRYAPLSAGLDILRKVLGKYELAVIQTTHMDRDRGLVLLTTTIAHSSGEWISALWPVCHITDIGHPKLMGAALTYARRYCLFTMVGLAGEDDLDAPEIGSQKELPAGREAPNNIPAEAAAGQQTSSNGTGVDHVAQVGGSSGPEVEAPEPEGQASDEQADAAALRSGQRERRSGRKARRSSFSRPDPVGDLSRIEDPEALLQWALKILPARNKLDDARREVLDAAFLARAETIGADPELLIPFGHRDEPIIADGPSPRAE
jgi:hypothetical protein